MKRIFILGDAALVEEYASLCLNKNLLVSGRMNSDRSLPSKTIRGFSKSTKPSKAMDIALELTNISPESKKKNLIELASKLGSRTPILTSSVTVTLGEQSTWVKSPQRLVGVGALPSLLRGSLVELTTTRQTDQKHLESAKSFVEKLGKQHSMVGDSVGMVMPRILCALANEAFFALKENVASGREIDTAMKLGTNYPYGPVEWAQTIGIQQVHAVMHALFDAFGEERYRPAPLLRQYASSGVSALQWL